MSEYMNCPLEIGDIITNKSCHAFVLKTVRGVFLFLGKKWYTWDM